MRCASAARRPLMAALSIVAGRPVSIQSPARNRPLDARAGRRPRRLARRQRERRAPLAHDRRALHPRRARVGQRLAQLAQRQRDQLVVRHRHHRVGAARHERQVRRARLEQLSACRTPTASPGPAAEKRRLQHRPIEPEVDAHDRRRAASPRPPSKRVDGRRCRRRTAPAARTTARRTTTAPARQPLAARLDVRHAAAVEMTRARRIRCAPRRRAPR